MCDLPNKMYHKNKILKYLVENGLPPKEKISYKFKSKHVYKWSFVKIIELIFIST